MTPTSNSSRILWLTLYVPLTFLSLSRPYEAQAGAVVGVVDQMVQTGHSDDLLLAQISPDDHWVATLGKDDAAILWDIHTGAEIRAFNGLQKGVKKLLFSPSGGSLAVGSRDGKVVLWDILHKEVKLELKGDDFIFLGDDWMAVSTNKAVDIWDTASGKKIRTLPAGSFSLAQDPSGLSLATLGPDGHVRIWDWKSGSLRSDFLTEMKGYAGQFALYFCEDGRRIRATDYKGNPCFVKWWDTQTGEEIKKANFPNLLRGKYYWKIQSEGLDLVDIETGEKAKHIGKGPDTSYPSYYGDFCLSPDGNFMGMVQGHRAFVYDLVKQAYLKDFSMKTRRTTRPGKPALNKNADFLAIGGKLWNLKNGKPVSEFFEQDWQMFPSSPVFTLDGTSFVRTGNSTGSYLSTPKDPKMGPFAYRVDLSKPTEKQDIPLPAGINFQHLGVLPGGKDLIGITGEGYESDVLILDGVRGVVKKKIHLSQVLILSAAMEQKGDLFAFYSSYGQEIRGIDLSGDGVAFEYKLFSLPYGNYPSSALAFTPDDRYLITPGRTESIGRNYWYQGDPKDSFSFELVDLKTGRSEMTFKGHDSHINDFSTNASGTLILSSGEDHTARLWDRATGKQIRIFSGHTGSVLGAVLSPDEKFVFTSSQDGTARVWNADSGRELCRIYSFEKGDWVAITPEGYFDGTTEGMKSIRWTVGLQSFPLDAFSESYYAPGLLSRVLSGEKIASAKLPNISEGFKLPPVVKIEGVVESASYAKETLDVKVTALDQGGGVDEVRFYQNGKLLGNGAGDIRGSEKKQGRISVTYRITLVDGENALKALALSNDRIESNPDEVHVTLTGPKQESTLHLFVVGINRYKNSMLNLNFAKPDALSVVDFLSLHSKGIFKAVEVEAFYDEQATKASIMAALKRLETLPPQDEVVIYMAGHGDTVNNDWYFIPQDLVYPEKEEEVAEKGLSSKELQESITRIGANKILVMLDACKSGGAVRGFAGRGFEERKVLSMLARATGVHLVAAAAKDQVAAEVTELKHGLFTDAVLEGLNGSAQGPQKDGIITVQGLLNYLENRLPELSRKYKTDAQYPVVDSHGMDFPIAANN